MPLRIVYEELFNILELRLQFLQLVVILVFGEKIVAGHQHVHRFFNLLLALLEVVFLNIGIRITFLSDS